MRINSQKTRNGQICVYIHARIYSATVKAVQRNKVVSPTWVATAVYSSDDAEKFFIKISALYNWTTLFFVHDKASSPLFYASASGFFARFGNGVGRYQVTMNRIDVANCQERTEVLRSFSTVGRGT